MEGSLILVKRPEFGFKIDAKTMQAKINIQPQATFHLLPNFDVHVFLVEQAMSVPWP